MIEEEYDLFEDGEIVLVSSKVIMIDSHDIEKFMGVEAKPSQNTADAISKTVETGVQSARDTCLESRRRCPV
jgi:hypothetical protein